MSIMLEKFNKDLMTKETNNIKLNSKQNYAYSLMSQGKNIFLTGPGGTGKTSLIRLMVECTPPTKKVQVCAMTGCAAILLNCHARTLHSWSGL